MTAKGLVSAAAIFVAGVSCAVTYDVSTFGANGSDNASDRVAIQTALDKAKGAREKVIVTVPNGTYYLDRSLFIYSNTELRLATGATFVRNGSTDGVMLRARHLRPSATGDTECPGDDSCTHGGHSQFSNITVSGGAWNAASTATEITGIFMLSHGSKLTISGVRFMGCTDHMLNISGSSDVVVEDCVFSSPVRYTGTDPAAWAPYEVGDVNRYNTIESIHMDFTDAEGEAGNYPLDGTGCERVTVTGCTFSGVFAGIGNHHAVAGRFAADLFVRNCSFTSLQGYAVDCFGITGCEIEGCTSSGGCGLIRASQAQFYATSNTVSGATEHGFFLVDVNKTRLVGNTVSGAAVQGVNLVEAAAEIIGNQVSDSGDCGIRADSGSSVVSSGNTIIEPTTYGFGFTGGSSLLSESDTVSSAGSSGFVVAGGGVASIVDAEVTSPSAVGIQLDGIESGEIRANTISSAGSHGIVLNNCQPAAMVYDNAISNPVGHGVVVVGGSADLRRNSVSSAGVNGVTAESAAQCTASGNTISGGQYGFCVKSGCSLFANGNTINGTSLSAVYAISARAMTCTDNEITAPGNCGFYMDQTIGAVVRGNSVQGSGWPSVWIKTSPVCEVSGNTIAGSAQEGIYCKDSSQCVVASNVVTGATKIGIRVDGTDNSRASAKISDNDVASASASGDIRVCAVATGYEVSGNICRGVGFTMESAVVDVTEYHPADARIISVDLTSGDTADVKWTNQAGVTGYFVEYSPSASFPVAATSRSGDVTDGSGHCGISGLSGSGTWYVRVKTFHTIFGTRYEALGDPAFSEMVSMSESPDAIHYSVHFDANGGSGTMADQPGFVYGTPKALNANAFTYAGYLFAGWSRSPTATSASYADGTSIARPNPAPQKGETITLYAVWARDASTYTVQFDGNGATSGRMADQLGFVPGKGGRTLTPNQFARTGYDFLGWAKYPASTTPLFADCANLVTSTAAGDVLVLYAVWQLRAGASYTICFDANGGSGSMSSKTDCIPGVACQLPKCKFTNTGYIFRGWARTANAQQAAYADEGMFSSNATAGSTVTLYAVWELDSSATYSVSFDGNGATSGRMADQLGFVPGKGGRTLTPNQFARTGYDFLGWAKYPASTTALFADCANLVTSTAAGDVLVLYAVWQLRDGASYTICFNANGGSGSMSSKTDCIPGVACQLPKCKFTNMGYIFRGWARTANAQQAAYADEGMFSSNAAAGSTVMLYAVWELDSSTTYSVCFDGNGATSGSMADQLGFVPGKGGRALSPNKFQNVGYNFLGWAKYPTSTTPLWTDGAVLNTSTAAGSTLVLYAVWKLDESVAYSVAFEANGGKGTMPVQPAFVYGKGRALLPNAFTRDGYIFRGWNRSMHATSATYLDGAMVYRPDPKVPVGGTMRLFAVWEPDSRCSTVSFDANGGEGAMDDQLGFLPGDAKPLSANAFERPGYTFGGWAITPDGAVAYADGSDFAADGPMTLYAVWVIDANCYSVQFNGNGATSGSMADQHGFYPGKRRRALAYNEFFRAGYRFLGWAKYPLSTAPLWSDGEAIATSTPAGTTLTLYAVWEAAPSTYAIAYDANGGAGAMPMQQGLEYDTPVTLLANSFTREGFDFVGWTDSIATAAGAMYADGGVVTCERPCDGVDNRLVRLYAVWRERRGYQIEFNKNEGSGQTSSIWLMPDELGQLPRLAAGDGLAWARRGFSFVGWSPAANSREVAFGDWECVQGLADEGEKVSLYALWSLNPGYYAISFIRNDGAGTWRTVGFEHGTKTRMPSLANGLGWGRRGYKFNGWALTAANANNVVIWKGDWANIATPTAAGTTLTIYASWTLKPGYYQIRFNKNDGSGKWRTLGFERDVTSKLNTIAGLGWERDGYEFLGWASNKANADAGKVWKLDGAWLKNVTDEGKTLSIYAVWAPVP